MHGVPADLDHGVEAVVAVGGVVHRPGGAVGLQEGVLALHHVAVPLLTLALHVSRVRVLDAIFESVLGMRLEKILQLDTAHKRLPDCEANIRTEIIQP